MRPPLINSTITTRIFTQLLLMSCIINYANNSIAADYEFKPQIIINQEYTDNIFETKSNRQNEYITRAMPGFTYRYETPFWKWDVGYNFDYRHYARGLRRDDYTHMLSALNKVSLIDNFLFLDISDTYKRVSLDVARDSTQDGLTNNQSDQNIGIASPYIVWRLGNNSIIKTGYRYSNTRYREPSGVDKSEHNAFVDGSHEVLPRFSLAWGYSYTNSKTSTTDFEMHDAYGGFRFEYADNSYLFGQGGNTWFSFLSGTNIKSLFWYAGLVHDFNFMLLTLETKVKNTEDPLYSTIRETNYIGTIQRSFDRGKIELSGSYSEYVITEQNKLNQRKVMFKGSAGYDLIDKLTFNISALAERFSLKTTTDYPYRFSLNPGLSYSFNKELTAGLNFTHVTYQNSILNYSDSRNINRIILELKKVF